MRKVMFWTLIIIAALAILSMIVSLFIFTITGQSFVAHPEGFIMTLLFTAAASAIGSAAVDDGF